MGGRERPRPFLQRVVVRGFGGGEGAHLQFPGSVPTNDECRYWMGRLYLRPIRPESLGMAPGVSAVFEKHPR